MERKRILKRMGGGREGQREAADKHKEEAVN